MSLNLNKIKGENVFFEAVTENVTFTLSKMKKYDKW